MIISPFEFTLSITAAIGIALLFWKKEIQAIAMVLFLLPTYIIRFSVIGIPMTMLETILLAVFVMAVFSSVYKKKPLFPLFTKNTNTSILVTLLCLFLLAAIFGILTTPNIHAGLGIFKSYIIEPLLFFGVLLSSVRTLKDIQTLTVALITSATSIAIIALIQYLVGWGIPHPWHDLPNRRATAIFGYPNAVGLYIAPIVTIAIGYILHMRAQFSKKIQYFFVGSITVCIAALFASHVEGALIGVAASTGVLMLFTRFKWYTVSLGILIFMGAILFEPTRQILLFQDVSGDVRIALWKGTWNLLSHQPFFGAGLGGFPETYDLYRLPSHVELLLYPHNFLFDVWVELGIIGITWLGGMLALLLYSLYTAIRFSSYSTRQYGIVFLALLVCVLMYGIVDVLYFKNDLSVLFWFWCACIILLPRLSKSV